MSRRLAAPSRLTPSGLSLDMPQSLRTGACLAKRLRVLAQPWNGRAAPWGST